MRFNPGKLFCIFLSLVLLASCTSTKNTGMTRWYHSFNTRYNVYFNGNEAYKASLKNLNENYAESYSEMVLMYPVSSLPKDKETTGGSFDLAIEKAVKAIKRHSIQTRPEKQPGKSRDPKYQEFMSRTEYNPFLHNAWMLMAKSQFYNGDFLPAASSFSYISRLYASQPEIALDAKIWQARCYSELEWFYEAEDILLKLNNDNLPRKLVNWYSSVYADYLIKQKQYRESIPYLNTSIKAERDKKQKARQKYLLGQIYTQLGDKDMAYKAFGNVGSASTPYVLEFSAKIRQTEVYPGGDVNKLTKQLDKMAKSSKNKDYLDQVYYAMGNIYMSVPDTTKALESYEMGVEKSTQNGMDKALNQIQLGDIYFQLRDYTKAQPNYSEALAQLKKGDDAFPRVSKRSEVLDELVIFHEAVVLQDSLQRLSRMSEEERMVVINKIIEDLIKKEKEEEEKAAREEYLTKQEDLRAEMNANRPQPPTPTGMSAAPTAPGGDSFYFYNAQAVALGKTTFQQRWGRRKLEDDWRRKDKVTSMLNPFEETDTANAENTESPEVASEGGNPTQENPVLTELSEDIKDPQFYLQQIPVTEEDLLASDLIIIDGLFNMGMIYKDKLEDYSLSVETFGTLDSRFPENEYKLEAYYQTYLIYWKLGDMQTANLYKSKIRAEFPESDYAIAMADPDYEYNLKMIQVIQDSLYQKTYDAYLNGDIPEIRANYELVTSKYSQSDLMPKFMFLNALSYIQSMDAEMFKKLLTEMIEKYPEADVSILAVEIMKGFQRGLLLSSSGESMLARGGIFNIRFGSQADSLAVDSTLVFSAEINAPHELLLIYPASEINKNLLRYTVADFNFGHFLISDFGLEDASTEEVGLLRITGFNNQEEVLQYLQMINQPEEYGYKMGEVLITVPISAENYTILMKGKSLDEYMIFFEENFEEGNETLIAGWRVKQEKELETLSEELEKEPEAEEDLLPEVEKEVEEEIQEVEPDAPINPEIPEQDTIDTNQPEMEIIEEPKEENIQTIEPEAQPEQIIDNVNEGLDKVDQINDKLNEIMSDPVRGIQNLFKRKQPNAIDEYVKQQEKEEKERQKLLKEEQKQKEKEAKELATQKEKEQREALKKQQEEEKATLKAKEEQEKALAKQKADEKKQAEAEKKRLAKEKEDARKTSAKQKEQERKDKEKQRELERKQKDQERKELQKQKDAERKERDKQRELERKQKEKEREEAQKQREAERKKK